MRFILESHFVSHNSSGGSRGGGGGGGNCEGDCGGFKDKLFFFLLGSLYTNLSQHPIYFFPNIIM